jgi:hypothetical protein
MFSTSTRLSFSCVHTYLTTLGIVLGFFVATVQRAECQVSSPQKDRTVEIPVFPHQIRRAPTYGGSFRPGQGYNSLLGAPGNMAVVDSGIAPPAKGIGQTSFTLQSAYSATELASKLDVSVTASFNALGGGTNSALNYAKQIATRQEDIYVVVSVDVKNTAQGLGSYKLEHKVDQDARSMSSDEFFKHYGDYFVSGIVYGGSYRGVLKIHNDSLAEKEDLKLHVDGHMGTFSASADMLREISSVTRNKTVTASVFREGGMGIINAEQLLEEATNFPPTVAPGANAVPLEVELQPYDAVFPKGITPPNTDAAYATLNYLTDETKKLNDLQDYLEFAKENAELFENPDQEKLKQEIKRAADATNQINISASKLMSHPTTATNHVIDYRSSYSEPELKNPPELPVTFETYSFALAPDSWEHTPSIVQGQPAGTPGKWIQAFSLKFANRTYGLSIHYDAYFACGHLTNQNAAHYALSDGELAGVPYGLLCALRSLTLNLSGPRAPFYEINYGGVMVQLNGNPTIWKKGGQTLQVEGPAFNSVSPATWMQQIKVLVTKRGTGNNGP